MDWWMWLVLLAGVAYFALKQKKNAKKAQVAIARLKEDQRLYEHICTGMREYNWREKQDFEAFLNRTDGELLFETADLAAYNVNHFAESRVDFYFKDLKECGLYGFFAGNGDEYHESYYRTDSTFKTEGGFFTTMTKAKSPRRSSRPPHVLLSTKNSRRTQRRTIAFTRVNNGPRTRSRRFATASVLSPSRSTRKCRG